MMRHSIIGIIGTTLILTASACTSGGGGSTTYQPSTTAPSGTDALVSLRDFTITLDKTTFTAGKLTFAVKNAGGTSHALALSGPGVSLTQTKALTPGNQVNLTFTAKPGTYTLWCPIDSHRSMGMETTITVAQ